jgi:hypothetical protein
MALPHESVDDEEESRSNGIIWLSDDEARARFDQTSRDLLGMSGDEFLRRLDAGEWKDLIDDGEHPDHLWLAMMRSFAE